MSIEDMIGQIENGDLTKANSTFNDLVMDRVNTAMDQEKIAVAATIFNGTEDIPEDDQIEMDFDDEDLEDEEYSDNSIEDED